MKFWTISADLGLLLLLWMKKKEDFIKSIWFCHIFWFLDTWSFITESSDLWKERLCFSMWEQKHLWRHHELSVKFHDVKYAQSICKFCREMPPLWTNILSFSWFFRKIFKNYKLAPILEGLMSASVKNSGSTQTYHIWHRQGPISFNFVQFLEGKWPK